MRSERDVSLGSDIQNGKEFRRSLISFPPLQKPKKKKKVNVGDSPGMVTEPCLTLAISQECVASAPEAPTASSEAK